MEIFLLGHIRLHTKIHISIVYSTVPVSCNFYNVQCYTCLVINANFKPVNYVCTLNEKSITIDDVMRNTCIEFEINEYKFGSRFLGMNEGVELLVEWWSAAGHRAYMCVCGVGVIDHSYSYALISGPYIAALSI